MDVLEKPIVRDRRLMILQDMSIPPQVKMVALALMDSERDDGYITGVTQVGLAKFLGTYQPNVARCIKQLREWGALESFHPESDEMEYYNLRHYNQVVYRFLGDYAPEVA